MQYFSEFPPWLTKGRPAFLECGTVPTSLPNSNLPKSCRYELSAWIRRTDRICRARIRPLAVTHLPMRHVDTSVSNMAATIVVCFSPALFATLRPILL